ncbi:MAG: sodium:calcium antiporter [Candidatus Melainabacteria bacterium]|nr:sodium:calcium antiporter [Candidatus Melainabacteria bacterium]
MLADIVFLILSLVIILASAELFTNGVEWLGQRLQLSEGAVGSVLAAVGTALPETLIPFVAVIFFKGRQGSDVGIGAIVGAPFMLSTLTLALCGWAMWFYTQRRRRKASLILNRVALARDLRFFICAYSMAIIATLATNMAPVRWTIAASLLGVYVLYLWQTFTHQGEIGATPERLHFDRLLNIGSHRLRLIGPQVVLGLCGIIGGAFVFVDRVQDLATAIGVPTVILSLIVAPIATELPEKVNSVLWARSGKDTLALGNITGAMVFQSCFPVAFGVAFTRWSLLPGTLAASAIALGSATIYLHLIEKGTLRPSHLMRGAIVYVFTICLLLATASYDAACGLPESSTDSTTLASSSSG